VARRLTPGRLASDRKGRRRYCTHRRVPGRNVARAVRAHRCGVAARERVYRARTALIGLSLLLVAALIRRATP